MGMLDIVFHTFWLHLFTWLGLEYERRLSKMEWKAWLYTNHWLRCDELRNGQWSIHVTNTQFALDKVLFTSGVLRSAPVLCFPLCSGFLLILTCLRQYFLCTHFLFVVYCQDTVMTVWCNTSTYIKEWSFSQLTDSTYHLKCSSSAMRSDCWSCIWSSSCEWKWPTDCIKGQLCSVQVVDKYMSIFQQRYLILSPHLSPPVASPSAIVYFLLLKRRCRFLQIISIKTGMNCNPSGSRCNLEIQFEHCHRPL